MCPGPRPAENVVGITKINTLDAPGRFRPSAMQCRCVMVVVWVAFGYTLVNQPTYEDTAESCVSEIHALSLD